MNNYIIINRTFTEITPESCEQSDFSDTGFISEGEQVTFIELVELMKVHIMASSSYDDLHTWYSTEFYTSDYGTGTQREESIHFSKNNTENAAKYWVLARKIATKKNCPVSR